MILLETILWLIAAAICAGVVMHLDSEDWDPNDIDDVVLLMFGCVLFWPLITVFGGGLYLGYLIMKRLAILPVIITGFLDGLRGEQDDKRREV